ncbi:MAG: glycosyltransferase family 2 protein [Acidobacteriota bacterium]
MDLTVVIINWNSGSCLAQLIDSLADIKDELRGILVADNASSDASLDSVQGESRLELIRFERNLGFAEAANRGISQADSEFILLLNPDVIVHAHSIRNLYRSLMKRPKAAIACGLLFDSHRRPQNSFQFRRLPTAWSVVRDALFLDEIGSMFRTKRCSLDFHEEGAEPMAGIAIGQQPAAAYWLLRKKAWESVGGFDPRFYPAWFEDVDFCKRIMSDGWEVIYVPDSPAIHQGGFSVEQLGYPAFVTTYYTNLLKYLNKHHPLSYPLLWLPVNLGILARRCCGSRWAERVRE